MIETDVQRPRMYAVKVTDDSMYPVFGEGEVVFMNPDLTSEPSHVDLAGARTSLQRAMVRDCPLTGERDVLRPLNRRYTDRPLTNHQCPWASSSGCANIFDR